MTLLEDRRICDELDDGRSRGERYRKGVYDVAEAGLNLHGPGAVTWFRELSAQAEAEGSETSTSWLMFAAAAEKLLANRL
jgi:hypothetical protein